MPVPATDITPHQARYYALELRRRGLAGNVDALGTALFDAQVDLNPHQIEAALVGMRATAERGRILADEVGLGKTIEAALVLCQRWAERRRRLLVIAPAALRKQWAIELESKFGLPVRIVEGRAAAAEVLDPPAVLVTSYNFAAGHPELFAQVPWDLVVLDEAHRLRNAWQPDSRMRTSLLPSFASSPKLLLTATPLQNSLMELYGLVSVVDQNVFGEPEMFRARFVRGPVELDELRTRLSAVLHRTLRRAVAPYVQYTARHSMTWAFRSGATERALYDAVTAFVTRDDLAVLPAAQRALTTMVLRKLLASSSAAICGALITIRDRALAVRRGEQAAPATWTDEGLDDDWIDGLLESLESPQTPAPDSALDAEIGELNRLIALASQITIDQRARELLKALPKAFDRMRELGAPEKAVIFTESRRTQEALRTFLDANGYAGRIVCFNGSNDSPEARGALDRWLVTHPDAKASASAATNMRAALVDHFQHHATLLIATEAGAEGLNLQFCSLVVNYDLPWNPQRVEQRIGRCHRYGQEHDVVVLNFVDQANAAEERVLELLQEKLGLFDGVFGASDEVLGRVAAEGGLERRLHQIFLTCRTPAEIAAAFDALRTELAETIREREENARRALIDHFDADVHDRLKTRLDEAHARLDRIGRLFWALTRWALQERAEFETAEHRFVLRDPPTPASLPGTYELVSRRRQNVAEPFVHRLSQPLGEWVVTQGEEVPTPWASLTFDLSASPLRVHAVEPLRGMSGWMTLERLRISNVNEEEHLLLSGVTSRGASVDAETLSKMLSLPARAEPLDGPPDGIGGQLQAAAEQYRIATLSRASERGHAELDQLREQLFRWSQDQVTAAELRIREVRLEIQALERRSRQAESLDDRQVAQRAIGEAEQRQSEARRRVFTVEDEVRARRNEILDQIERRLEQRSVVDTVFAVAWTVT